MNFTLAWFCRASYGVETTLALINGGLVMHADMGAMTPLYVGFHNTTCLLLCNYNNEMGLI